MKTKIIDLGGKKLVEYISDKVLINNVQDALDLIANTPSTYLILYEKNFLKEFFDLSSGVLGEILQKFTNYKVRLAIIGNYEKFKSKSLRDFIYESNKNGEYLFVDSLERVKEIWRKFI